MSDSIKSGVSIILPTYNRAHTLARSIDSILKQSYQAFELIIVNDSSTDETKSVVQSFTDERIRYIELSKNSGAAAARNAGVAAAKHEVLGFQDSDDEWDEHKLSLQLEALDEETGVVYCDMLRIKVDGSLEVFRAPEIRGPYLVDLKRNCWFTQDIGIQSTLIRRRLFDEVGGFDESLVVHEDLELFIRLSRICKFKHLPQPLVRYHETDGLMSNYQRIADARMRLLQKYRKELSPYKAFVANELRRCKEFEMLQRQRDGVRVNC